MTKTALPNLAVLLLCIALQACATTSSNKTNSDDEKSAITEKAQSSAAVINPDPFEKENGLLFHNTHTQHAPALSSW